MKEMNERITLVKNMMSVLFMFGVLIGSIALGVYWKKLEYFPEGVSIGDGLMFIIIAVAFSFMCLIFVASMTSLGLVLKPVWIFLLWLFAKVRSLAGKQKAPPAFTFKKLSLPNYLFAILGLIFVLRLVTLDWVGISTTLVMLFGCAVLWSQFDKNDNKMNSLDKACQGDERKSIARHQMMLLMSLILTPPLSLGAFGSLAESAMRLVTVRVENVTVHVKEPYNIYALEAGIQSKSSHFGEVFHKFEHATQLFKGLGKKTLISVSDASGKHIQISVPNELVHIVKP